MDKGTDSMTIFIAVLTGNPGAGSKRHGMKAGFQGI